MIDVDAPRRKSARAADDQVDDWFRERLKRVGRDNAGLGRSRAGVITARILGIDPGTERTGWGVVESRGHDFTALDYGCIITKKEDGLPARLLSIWEHLNSIIEKHAPEVIAVEELFFAKNATSAIHVGHGRGICLLSAATHGLPVEEVTPSRSNLPSSATETHKAQVGTMVQRILGLAKIPRRRYVRCPCHRDHCMHQEIL